MKLSSILNEDQIILNLDSNDRVRLISEMVNEMDRLDLLMGEKVEDIVNSLCEREDKISTGIGSGVAIPHTFSDKIDQVVAIFGRSKDGIDYESIDNAPVHFVMLFIVPQKEYHLHLQTLAAIAKMLNNSEVRSQLAEAETKTDILDVLSARSSRVHVERGS